MVSDHALEESPSPPKQEGGEKPDHCRYIGWPPAFL
jgi:hypothetical protein